MEKKKSPYYSKDPELMWMNDVPEVITKELINNLHQKYSSKYIIYRRHKWGADCYCTNCRKRFSARKDIVIDTPFDATLYDIAVLIHSGRTAVCPYCGEKALARSAGYSRKAMYENHNFTVFKVSEDGNTVWGICGTFLPRIDRQFPEEPADIHINPAFEEYYVFQMRPGEVKMAIWNWMKDGFINARVPNEPYIGWFYNAIHFDDFECTDELNKSFLRYIIPQLKKSNANKQVKLLQLCALYPKQIEMLLKSGFGEMIDSIADGAAYKRTINLAGKNPAEIFKTDPNHATEICRYARSCSMYDRLGILERIRFFKAVLKIDKNVKIEFACEVYSKYIDGGTLLTFNSRDRSKNIIDILKCTGLTLQKFVNYIERQYHKYDDAAECCHIGYIMRKPKRDTIITYIDYLHQCRELEYDLKNSVINRPKDLEAAHDRASAAFRATEAERFAKRDAKVKKKYQDRYTALCEKYAYSNGEYSIIVPTGAAEIIDEGKNQNNCVAGYAERHLNGVTTILFLRKTKEPYKSFGTLEVKRDSQGKTYFVQAEGTNCGNNHRKLADDARQFLDKWLEIVNRPKKEKSHKTA